MQQNEKKIIFKEREHNPSEQHDPRLTKHAVSRKERYIGT